MSGYLRRLATTGAAYTAASIISKLIAVALLPLYTRYLTPADYGAAEVMFAAVVAASIVIRLGVIEALLRFYYKQGEDPDKVVATSFAMLFWAGLITTVVCFPFAEPISQLLLGVSDPNLVRIAIPGLFVLTLSEYLLTIFRLDERARAFFTVTMLSVLFTIPITVVLVVPLDMGAEGLLLGSYGTGLVMVLGLIAYHWHRLSLVPDRPLLRRMMRFGLPTMPAELSLYSLSFIDRILIARTLGLAEAGLYALAIKVSQGIAVLVRGFQLAFPPLAYSIQDDDEAARAYSAVVTWFVVVMAFVVTFLWLAAPWIVRVFAAPDYFDAAEVVGPVSAGAALYALYMVLLVVLGRTGRTEYNLPATIAGLVVNVGLNLLLLPVWGIIGAGVSLVVSYLVVVMLMYIFTQRLFPVPYEWLRLARVLLASAALIAIGEVFVPQEGIGWLAVQLLLVAALPFLLLVTGFFTQEERGWLLLLTRPAELKEKILEARAAGKAAGEDGPDGKPRRGGLPEAVEVEQWDEDLRN
ncbi:MAG: Oligosaccharide flippase family protein [Actinomycetota bacterium]|jgi:O-antigen/teichoic acid export membrane protein|nr:Oligosaccharide flippase family protein [Actinomycetota bacterium]